MEKLSLADPAIISARSASQMVGEELFEVACSRVFLSAVLNRKPKEFKIVAGRWCDISKLVREGH